MWFKTDVRKDFPKLKAAHCRTGNHREFREKHKTQAFYKFLSLLKSYNSCTQNLPTNSGAQLSCSSLSMNEVMGRKCIQRLCGGSGFFVGSSRAKKEQVQSNFVPPTNKRVPDKLNARFQNEWPKAALERWSGRRWLTVGESVLWAEVPSGHRWE